jgi:hypothetical protein
MNGMLRNVVFNSSNKSNLNDIQLRCHDEMLADKACPSVEMINSLDLGSTLLFFLISFMKLVRCCSPV